MSIIVFAIVIVLLAALLVWAVSLLTALPSVPKQIIMALIVVLAVVAIANRAGIF